MFRKISFFAAGLIFSFLITSLALAAFTEFDLSTAGDKNYFSLRNENADSSVTDNIIPYSAETQLCKKFESNYNTNYVYEVNLYGFDRGTNNANLRLRIYSDENGKPKNILSETAKPVSTGSYHWEDIPFTAVQIGKIFWACAYLQNSNEYGFLKFSDSLSQNTDYYFASDGTLSLAHPSRVYTIRAKLYTVSGGATSSTTTSSSTTSSTTTSSTTSTTIPPTTTTAQTTTTTLPPLEEILIKNEEASYQYTDNIVPPSPTQLCKKLALPKAGLTIFDVEVVGLDRGSKTFDVNIYNDNNGKPSENLKRLTDIQFNSDGRLGAANHFSVKPTENFWVCLSSKTNEYGHLKFDSVGKNTDFYLNSDGSLTVPHSSRTYSIRAYAKDTYFSSTTTTTSTATSTTATIPTSTTTTLSPALPPRKINFFPNQGDDYSTPASTTGYLQSGYFQNTNYKTRIKFSLPDVYSGIDMKKVLKAELMLCNKGVVQDGQNAKLKVYKVSGTDVASSPTASFVYASNRWSYTFDVTNDFKGDASTDKVGSWNVEMSSDNSKALASFIETENGKAEACDGTNDDQRPHLRLIFDSSSCDVGWVDCNGIGSDGCERWWSDCPGSLPPPTTTSSETTTTRLTTTTTQFTTTTTTTPPSPGEIYLIKNEKASFLYTDNIIPKYPTQLCKKLTLPKTSLSVFDVEVVGLDRGSKTFDVNIYNDGNSKPSQLLKSLSNIKFNSQGRLDAANQFSVIPTQNFWVCLSSKEGELGFLKFDSEGRGTDFNYKQDGTLEPAHSARTYSIRAYAKEFECQDVSGFGILSNNCHVPQPYLQLQTLFTTDPNDGSPERVFKSGSDLKFAIVVRNNNLASAKESLSVQVQDENGKVVENVVNGDIVDIPAQSYKTMTYTWNSKNYAEHYSSGFRFVGKKFKIVAVLSPSGERREWGFYVDEFGVPKWLRDAKVFYVEPMGNTKDQIKNDFINKMYDAQQKGFDTISLGTWYYNYGYTESHQWSGINSWFPAGSDSYYEYSTPPDSLTKITNNNRAQARAMIRELVDIAHKNNMKVLAYVDPMAIYSPINGAGDDGTVAHHNSLDIGFARRDFFGNIVRANFLESFLTGVDRFAVEISPSGPAKNGAQANNDRAFSPETIKNDLTESCVDPDSRSCLEDPSHNYHFAKQILWLTQNYNFDAILSDDTGRLIMAAGPRNLEEFWSWIMRPAPPSQSLYGLDYSPYAINLKKQAGAFDDQFELDAMANMIKYARLQLKSVAPEKVLISSDYFVPGDVGWKSINTAEDMSNSDQFSISFPSFARWAYKTYNEAFKPLRNDLRRSLIVPFSLAPNLEMDELYWMGFYRPDLVRGALLGMSWANGVNTEYGGDLYRTPETKALLTNFTHIRKNLAALGIFSLNSHEILYHSHLKDPNYQTSELQVTSGSTPYTVLYKQNGNYGEKARILHIIDERVLDPLIPTMFVENGYDFKIKLPKGQSVSNVMLYNPNTAVTGQSISWKVDGEYIYITVPGVRSYAIVIVNFNPT